MPNSSRRPVESPILVTGGLGFIGSAFIRSASPSLEVLCVDSGTYAADRSRVAGTKVEVLEVDVRDQRLNEILFDKRPRTVVHFAAETHVTRSEKKSNLFFDVNVEGTRNVLQAANSAGVSTFLHISTDEVYGSASDMPFKEEDKDPGEGKATSAYARSKALADDLVLSTDSATSVIVARLTNCFGPWQHPEKAIPRWISRALDGQTLPVWGDGEYVRDWLHVSDAVDALILLLAEGVAGTAYNIGPQNDVLANLELAKTIANLCRVPERRVHLTQYDRPGHDRRYFVDASRMRRLGWSPRIPLLEGLERTVDWYRENQDWWRSLSAEAEALYSDEAVRTS